MKLINKFNLANGLTDIVIFISLLVLNTIQFSRAQDLNDLIPKKVPQQIAPTKEQSLQAINRAANFGATNDEDVILKKLKGLIFLDSPDALKQEPATYMGTKILDVSLFTFLQDESFSVAANTFIGLPVSRESLKRLERMTSIHLKQLGRPFTVVFLPEQDITDGYVQIVVLESNFTGEIEVQGNQYFSDEQYQQWIRQSKNDVINTHNLNQDIDWINRNPFRTATVIASPGDEQGTTKLIIKAREKKPVRVYTGFNNTGSQSTTEDRALVGVNWGNAFGLGHQLNMQLTSDLDFKRSKSLSGSYNFDTTWRHSVSVSAAYSETDGIVQEPFSLKGKSGQMGVFYTLPFSPKMTGNYTHSLNIGADFKVSDNNFDFADIPISDNLTHVIHGKIQYSVSLVDSYGSTNGSITLIAAPGGLTSRNEDEFFKLSRSNASANYIYSTLNLTRNTQLTGILSGWQWRVRGKLQLSNSNLIGSEQFGAGGSNSVRGYEEGEVFGDEGVLFSQEVIAPMMSLTKMANMTMPDSLSLFLFQDYAQTRSVVKLPDEKNFILHSIGVGFRYQLAQLLTVNASYGHQLKDSGSSDTGKDHRLHLSMQLSF